MENKSFIFLKQFLDAFEYLPEKDRYRANYCLCYYGLYREFPEEATDVDKALIMANARLFEGQDKFMAKQAENAQKGGRPASASDEQIRGAIIELYEKNGAIPTESETINFIGGGVKRIATRQVWKDRTKIIAEHIAEENGGPSLFQF